MSSCRTKCLTTRRCLPHRLMFWPLLDAMYCTLSIKVKWVSKTKIYIAHRRKTSNALFYTMSQKTVQNCFCKNVFKFPPILIIFGRKMAKRLKVCEVHSFFTSANLCQHTTVLSAYVANCYTTLTFVMVALCNRADHYIFILFLVLVLSSFFSSPNLSGRRLDVYHTLAHGVALVRI